MKQKPNLKLLDAVMKMEDALRSHKLTTAEEFDLLIRLLAARIAGTTSRNTRGYIVYDSRNAVVETLDEYIHTIRTEGPHQ